MTRPTYSLTPSLGILAALVYCAIAALMAVFIASSQASLGLSLTGTQSGQVQAQACHSPCTHIPPGAVIKAISAANSATTFEVEAFDLTEEPDVLPNHTTIQRLFNRQNALHNILQSPEVDVYWASSGASTEQQVARIQPVERPLHALPVMFWFQLFVSTLGCLLGSWIWALRPKDWGARIFGFSGLMFPVFAMAAAVYSTRELAISANLFANLSLINHFGALVYGAAFAGIFLAHPRLLVKPAILIALPVIAAAWWSLSAFGIITNPDWTIRFPTLFEMLAAVVLGIVQWILSRKHAQDRAALRWLVISFLLGGGLFIANHVVSSILRWIPPIPQGYAFGFFLLIYLGIALGLSRYRLFDLDVWAYRVLLFVTALLGIIAFDIALITLLGWSETLALGSAIWIVGLLYLAVRHWLWNHLTQRGKLRLDRVLPELVEVAFEPTSTRRQAQWIALLNQLYAPALVEPTKFESPSAALIENGSGLMIPNCARMSAQKLMHRDHGRRLFSPADVALISAMCNLMNRAETGRLAFESAVLSERKRIARDLHDDVGAALLMLIHRAPSQEISDLARGALGDLRAALSAIDGEAMPLSYCLADLRSEAQTRCDAANVELVWNVRSSETDPVIEPRLGMVLTRALRECLSNCFKHSKADPLVIKVSDFLDDSNLFELVCGDNGSSACESGWKKGRGLIGLEQRLLEFKGSVQFVHSGTGNKVHISLPIPPNEVRENT